MVDGAQQLPASGEAPANRVAELLEDVVAGHHLVAQGPLGAGRPMVGLELSVGALYDFESGLELEVVDEIRGEVVSRSERRVQVRRRRERHATDVGQGHLVGEADNGVALVVEAAPSRPPGHLGVFAAGEKLAPGVGVLGKPLEGDRARGHVDAERESLGGEDHGQQVHLKADLDDLAEGRHHPGVVSGESPP